MKSLCCPCVSRTTPEEDTKAANDLIDSILTVISTKIREEYNDSIKVPDINERFSKKVTVVLRIN
jgi:hypothetical protein